MKIIIWGYPLHSHTHSYIHDAFYRTFKHMGYETYWFHDGGYPNNFNWDDCIFWTEGFADKNIPLNKTSIYFVHVCPNPRKYIGQVKRFIDVRYNHLWHNDHCYSYTINKSELKKVGPCCYLQEKENKQTRVKNNYQDYMIEDYDKLYFTWAANFFPEQFNLDDVNYPRKNVINFCGNLTSNGRCENLSTFRPFMNECNKHHIPFIHNCPFSNPLSDDEVIKRTKESLLGVDIRGPEHIRNGYVPCRVFKSISYGHLGMTNSKEVFNEMEGHCIFNENTAQLFHDAMAKKDDKEYIRNSMLYVRDNHTYINRINTILGII